MYTQAIIAILHEIFEGIEGLNIADEVILATEALLNLENDYGDYCAVLHITDGEIHVLDMGQNKRYLVCDPNVWDTLADNICQVALS